MYKLIGYLVVLDVCRCPNGQGIHNAGTAVPITVTTCTQCTGATPIQALNGITCVANRFQTGNGVTIGSSGCSIGQGIDGTGATRQGLLNYLDFRPNL